MIHMSTIRDRIAKQFSTKTANADGKIDVTLENVKEYLRIDFDEDDMLLNLMLESAKGFVCSYTKQTEAELAGLLEIKMAVMLIVSHYYDNRAIDPTSKNIDFILRQTLGMHHLYFTGVM